VPRDFGIACLLVTRVHIRSQKDHVTKANVASLYIPNLWLTHQFRNVNVQHCPDQLPGLCHDLPDAQHARGIAPLRELHNHLKILRELCYILAYFQNRYLIIQSGGDLEREHRDTRPENYR
jgi:hypothetical protein